MALKRLRYDTLCLESELFNAGNPDRVTRALGVGELMLRAKDGWSRALYYLQGSVCQGFSCIVGSETNNAIAQLLWGMISFPVGNGRRAGAQAGRFRHVEKVN